jgi:hypothetical protein
MKLQWKKVPGLDEWTAPGYGKTIYTIEQMNDDPITMVATATGEGNRSKYTATAKRGETAAQLLKRVKLICEEQHRRDTSERLKEEIREAQRHGGEQAVPQAAIDACRRAEAQEPPPEQAAKLGVATALEWTTKEGGELMAGPYTILRSRAGEVWRAHYHDPAAAAIYLGADPEPDPLQQLCFEHKAGEGLDWYEEGPGHWHTRGDGPGYCCTPDGEQWLASSDVLPGETGTEIGPADDLAGAMALCQIHRGQMMLQQLRDAEIITQGIDEGLALADKVANKPARERGDWMIPVPLTEPEAAAKGRLLGEITIELGEQTLEIARANDDRKRRVRAAEDEIKRLNDEALPLAEQLEAGEEHRLVDCVKHKGDGEIWYTHPDTGEELHRHAVPRGEQQGLWGERPPPPDKPPAEVGSCGSAGVALDEAKIAELREAAKGADEVRHPGDEQPATDLPADRELTRADFTRQTSGDYLAGDPEGEHYRISRPESDRRYRTTFHDATGARQLMIGHLRLKHAIEALNEDNRKRLRWPCSPKANVQVSACNRYQVTLTGSGDRHRPESWRAEAVGRQDEDNVGLGEHGSLAEARAACQAHKDGEAAS